MVDDYPWYTFAEGDEKINQGDFIKECTLFNPLSVEHVEENSEVEGDTIISDIVVMSQSCDLEHDKLDIVLVCPICPLSYFEEQAEFYKGKDGKEALRKGYLPGYHLLNICDIEGFERDLMVLDFRGIYGVSFDYISKLAKTQGKRLRLLPPYREHLSQAFAKFFMRVGLPVEISSFKKDRLKPEMARITGHSEKNHLPDILKPHK